MLITLYSAQGLPVHPEHKKACQEEMTKAYDELEKAYGAPKPDTVKYFSDKLEPLHNELMGKYPISNQEHLPTPFLVW